MQRMAAHPDGQETSLIKISSHQTCATVCPHEARPDEGRDEQWAREIVSKILGVPVERFDDGTANSMVDAEVHYSDRKAALEVVADHDSELTEQGAVLHDLKHRIEVSGLRQSWMVILSGKANLSEVKRALRKSLPAWQDNPPPASDLHQLGILSAEPTRYHE